MICILKKEREREAEGVLQCGSEMSPKGSCVEGLVPNTTMFRSNNVGSWASDLSGLIHWWVHNLIGYWEVLEM
jgi:hypothetical protein